jgi:hypothetical protein
MNQKMARRAFIKGSSITTLGIGMIPSNVDRFFWTEDPDEIIDVYKFLENILYTKKEVDLWLAGKAFPFAKYNSEFGWLLNNDQYMDGVDNSVCTYTYAGEDGERLMSNYKEIPCRINTYGNSFTQCHQVSDHETWQEVLAAHLQEPVRNFGIGGWSVYQAYLRMLKEEQRSPAEHIIFNIYTDDHRRNLDSWRTIRVRKHVRFIEPTLPYVKVNVQKDAFIECKNSCPTPESVYNLCDIDQVYEMFKDDFTLHIMLAHLNSKVENPYKAYSDIMNLATTHGIVTEVDNNDTLAQTAEDLHHSSALFSTQKIIEKIEDYASANNKKVLYVLSHPAGSIAQYAEERKRWDQPFVDYMRMNNFPFVDLMDSHMQEYSSFRGEIREYLQKYYIGHYNPRGNLFCAFAIKDKLLELLDPKSFPYRQKI